MIKNYDEQMENVKFLPWIGDRYEEGFRGCKLLVVGESHYSVDNDDKYITRRLTSEYIEYQWNHLFWTNIIQVLSGKHHSELSRDEVWHKICFYNYIQESLDKARTAPDENMWKSSEINFIETLNCLRPDKVLVLGYRLWNRFDFDGKDAGKITSNGSELALWEIHGFDNTPILCGNIQHPSSAFSSKQWAPLVSSFLSK